MLREARDREKAPAPPSDFFADDPVGESGHAISPMHHERFFLTSADEVDPWFSSLKRTCSVRLRNLPYFSHQNSAVNRGKECSGNNTVHRVPNSAASRVQIAHTRRGKRVPVTMETMRYRLRHAQQAPPLTMSGEPSW